MSLHHENIAWRAEEPGLKKIVLLFVYRHAHLSSLDGFLTHQHIAHACCISESAARKFVAELESAGYFTRRRVDHGFVYTLTLPEGTPA